MNRRNEWQLAAVESVLNDLPRLIMDKNNLSDYLVNSAAFPSSPGQNTACVHGGQKVYQQERYAQNPQLDFLHRLEHVVIVVNNGFAQLEPQEADAVRLTCFNSVPVAEAAEQFECSERWIAELRKRAFKKMKNCCMEVLRDVEAWRRWVQASGDSSLSSEGF